MWLRIAGQPRSSFELFVSAPILNEVKDKLITKFGFSEERTENFVEAIRERADVVEPRVSLNVVPGDPDDNMVLECAVAAKANLVISADKDLLELNPFRRIGISHPRELKNIFRSDLRVSE